MTSGRTAGQHLALVGPTASGKSAVGLELALLRNRSGRPTEIVSCDSMQVYRGMDIGTAKPTIAERELVAHHMIDLVDPCEEHNLRDFLEATVAVIDDIEGRGSSALLVGGTGLYVRGVVDGFTPPPRYPQVAAALEAEPDTDVLAARLRDLDPVALGRIPPGNRRRIVRALEVTIGSGQPFSSHGEALEQYRPTPFVLAGLWPSRDVLTARIGARYDAQMADGLLAEVVRLAEIDPGMSRTAAQALGYRELLDHLNGNTTLEAALANARVRTRRFAVRQQRWFGRDHRIVWFDPPGHGSAALSVAALLDELWQKRVAGATPSVATVDRGPAGHAAGTGK